MSWRKEHQGICAHILKDTMEGEGSRDGQREKVNSGPVSTEPLLTSGLWRMDGPSNSGKGASLFMPASPNRGSTLALGRVPGGSITLGWAAPFGRRQFGEGRAQLGGVSSQYIQQVWKLWLWGGIWGHTVASTKSILCGPWIQLLQIIS